MSFEPVVLEGSQVRLEPLEESHKDGLCKAISDGELWNIFVTLVPHTDAIYQFFANAKAAHEKGEGLTFATIDQDSGNQIAGSTRFMSAIWPMGESRLGSRFGQDLAALTGEHRSEVVNAHSRF
ncbi:MAG: hypothetical protein OSB75_09710 [Dehalococcoidia bacterium]|nr:hypothetical protein [Dehalococcoidia bacterium]|tara:strand:- start:600 stop:971 length:372 start_codon:yes stop_codon:yes gene_type:complete